MYYCPHCNKNTDKEVCPDCGQVCTERTESSGTAERNAATVWGERVLRLAPTAAFGLLSLLLWAFFAASFATVAEEPIGSLYAMLGEIGVELQFQSIAIAAVVAAALCLIVAALRAVAASLPLFSEERKLAGMLSPALLLDGVCALLSLVPAVIGIVCMAQAGGETQSASAAGILVFVFSLLSFLVCIGAVVAYLLLEKKNSAFAHTAQTVRERREKKHAVFCEQRARLKYCAAEEVLEPEAVEPPEKAATKRLKAVERNRLYLWAPLVAFCCALIIFTVFAFAPLKYDEYTDTYTNQVQEYGLILAFLHYFPIAMTCGFLCGLASLFPLFLISRSVGKSRPVQTKEKLGKICRQGTIQLILACTLYLLTLTFLIAVPVRISLARAAKRYGCKRKQSQQEAPYSIEEDAGKTIAYRKYLRERRRYERNLLRVQKGKRPINASWYQKNFAAKGVRLCKACISSARSA